MNTFIHNWNSQINSFTQIILVTNLVCRFCHIDTGLGVRRNTYSFSAGFGSEPYTEVTSHGQWAVLTTSARTRVRTFSPISGEMSLPNCCRVVRKRFNLLSCRAPQVAGNCWFVSADDVEEAGPLLNLCGGDGAPFRVGGEWLVPLLTERKPKRKFLSAKYKNLWFTLIVCIILHLFISIL